MYTHPILLFPGQGSQSIGMASDLWEHFPQVRQTFEEASDTLHLDMKSLCFEDPSQQLNLTAFTQPAILTVSTAVFRTLQAHRDLSAHAVAGHSLGEYGALVAAGALSFVHALRAVHVRGQEMQQAVPVGVGSMAAYLGTQCEAVEQLCKATSTPDVVVEVVNFNSPGQLVISGHTQGVETVCGLIVAQKLGKAKILPVSAPFHSSLMQPAAQKMKIFLQNTPLNPLQTPLVANVDAQYYEGSTYTKDLLVRQIASPVLWTQSLQTLQSQGLRGQGAKWIEVGPGKVLKGLTEKTLAGVSCDTTHNFEALKALLDQTPCQN